MVISTVSVNKAVWLIRACSRFLRERVRVEKKPVQAKNGCRILFDVDRSTKDFINIMPQVVAHSHCPRLKNIYKSTNVLLSSLTLSVRNGFKIQLILVLSVGEHAWTKIIRKNPWMLTIYFQRLDTETKKSTMYLINRYPSQYHWHTL